MASGLLKRDLGRDPVTDLAYYTDCQIATYSWQTLVKKTAKSELSRQRSICEGMLASCKTHGLDAKILSALQERFDHAKEDDRSLPKAVAA